MFSTDLLTDARSPGALSASSGLRVLVVDDHVDGADAMCAFLASMGCTTAVAFDGAQGLAAASLFDPQLALIDLELPDMCGCDVVRQLRAGVVAPSARLVCLTGRGQPEDRHLCLAAGFDSFFTKPMLPDRLRELVAETRAELLR
jgi:CheY-like chemotaxis protein